MTKMTQVSPQSHAAAACACQSQRLQHCITLLLRHPVSRAEPATKGTNVPSKQLAAVWVLPSPSRAATVTASLIVQVPNGHKLAFTGLLSEAEHEPSLDS